ncbi:hypothetical protein [Nocardioides sp.]|uniref:hypothetical protein n=1 Tax=Nocardioides sp. TaxID=35761 RepID=UPI002B2668C7|nr:hypothetical protein [Nocardioides sp.]
MTLPARTAALLLATALSATVLGGCSALTPSGRLGEAVPAPAASSAPDQRTPQRAPEQAEQTACDEVVAGIEAFNRGDFEETVNRFERALPLAQAEDDAAGTRLTAGLLEAVEYYAALPPGDYLAASVGSPDFARYKAITLGLCGSGQPQLPGNGGGDGGGIQA